MKDFCAKMERGKDRAQRDRNRGMSTGKAAAGHARRPRPASSFGTLDRAQIIRDIAKRVDADIDDEDAARVAYPERYEYFI